MTIKFEPNDLWIGLYIKKVVTDDTEHYQLLDYTYYLCVVPCFPIIWSSYKFVFKR